MSVVYKDEEWEIVEMLSKTFGRVVTHYILENTLGERVEVKASAVTFLNNRG